MLYNITTKEKVWEHDFKTTHSNKSFPLIITNEILKNIDDSFVVLNIGQIPLYESHQKIEEDGVEQIGGEWYTKYKVSDLSQDEILDLSISVRNKRNVLLSQSDWTQGKDTPDEISLKWMDYRQSLRDVTNQIGFPFNVDWPVAPQ